ncbi:hypothetical protein LguiB_019788 [Lonicera macranthoides]
MEKEGGGGGGGKGTRGVKGNPKTDFTSRSDPDRPVKPRNENEKTETESFGSGSGSGLDVYGKWGKKTIMVTNKAKYLVGNMWQHYICVEGIEGLGNQQLFFGIRSVLTQCEAHMYRPVMIFNLALAKSNFILFEHLAESEILVRPSYLSTSMNGKIVRPNEFLTCSGPNGIGLVGDSVLCWVVAGRSVSEQKETAEQEKRERKEQWKQKGESEVSRDLSPPFNQWKLGLWLIDNDKDISDMMVHVQATCGIEIYFDHDKGKSKVNDTAPNAPTTPIAPTDEMMDDVKDEVGEESENESDGSLDIDTDNEELVEIMKKIHSLRLKIKQVSAPNNGNHTISPLPLAHTALVNAAPIDIRPGDTDNVNDDFVIDNVDDDFMTDNVGDREYDSEDVDSDQHISPLSSEYKDGSVRRNKERYLIFNSNIDFFKIEPVKGMKFADPDQLKHALRCYAVANGFPIKFKRNSKHWLLGMCAEGCPRRLWATYMQNEYSFQIKSLRDEHKCIRNFKIKLANSKWLAKQYEKKIIANPK